jgi:hypothetical protein
MDRYIDLIKAVPEFNKYIGLCAGSSLLTLDDIESNMNLNWWSDWTIFDTYSSKISERKDLTIEFIKKHINEKWDWDELSIHNIITPHVVLNNPDMLFEIETLYENKNFTYDDFCNLYGEDNVKHDYLIINPNITWDIIEHIVDKYGPQKWKFIYDCPKHLLLDYHMIKKYIPDFDNKFYEFHNNYKEKIRKEKLLINKIKILNPVNDWNLMINMIIKNNIMFYKPDEFLCINANINEKLILDNPDIEIKLNWFGLTKNKNIPLNFIYKNIDKNIDFNFISDNEFLDIDFVLAHLDKPWNWFLISKNKNFVWNKIKQTHNFIPWDPKGVSLNSNITPSIVINNLDYNWNIGCLANNFDR